jgi:hypothetical protein
VDVDLYGVFACGLCVGGGGGGVGVGVERGWDDDVEEESGRACVGDCFMY